MSTIQAENATVEREADVANGSIHLSLQGKGGVGKSLIASILAQYFRQKGDDVQCIDTDPVNQTLAQYRALRAQHLELLLDGQVDQRRFDVLLERILTEEAVFVVDSGASTFIPLWNYLLENDVMQVLRQAHKRLYVHTVVTGGQALLDTLKGFRSLAESTSDRNLIVWINEYFGRVEYAGKAFEQMQAYELSKDKVFGSVQITKRNNDTFGRDIHDVITTKLTFDEAIRDGAFSLMAKQRLRVVQRDLFEQIDRLGF
jgi:hypothetical protein